jgi:hypothetical protein
LIGCGFGKFVFGTGEDLVDWGAVGGAEAVEAALAGSAVFDEASLF